MKLARRFFSLLTLILLTGCLSSVSLPEKFQTLAYKPSGQNSKFDYKGDTFAGYIEHTKNKIRSVRQNTPGIPASESVINGNAPFEIIPTNAEVGSTHQYKRAVILVHGAFGSPYELREIAQKYAKMGFIVRAPLLPGHGTIPGDQLKSGFKDWSKAVDFAIKSTQKIADEVHLAGYSVGAGIAILKAYDYPIKTVALFSPLVEINSSIEQYSGIAAGVGSVLSKAHWSSLSAPNNPYKYNTMSFKTISESHLLQKRIVSRIKKPLGIPVFAVASEDDYTALFSATMNFFKKLPNPNSRFILYTTKPLKNKDARIKSVRSDKASGRILNTSHLSIVSPRSNPVYGINGSAKLCNIYKKDPVKLEKCLSAPSNSVYFSE